MRAVATDASAADASLLPPRPEEEPALRAEWGDLGGGAAGGLVSPPTLAGDFVAMEDVGI